MKATVNFFKGCHHFLSRQNECTFHFLTAASHTCCEMVISRHEWTRDSLSITYFCDFLFFYTQLYFTDKYLLLIPHPCETAYCFFLSAALLLYFWSLLFTHSVNAPLMAETLHLLWLFLGVSSLPLWKFLIFVDCICDMTMFSFLHAALQPVCCRSLLFLQMIYGTWRFIIT